MFRLYLFGPPVIEQAGQQHPRFKNRKAEALLFYLAVMPGSHQRAHLAGLLWSELSQEKALNNLRHTLWTIRQTLGEQILVTDRLTVGLLPTDDLWIDTHEFQKSIRRAADRQSPKGEQALQQAAQIYRGEFLAEVEVTDALLFDEWLEQQRLVFHEMAIDVFTRLAAYYTQHHYLPEAVATTRRLLELDPWREIAHQQLMSLLALSGQRGAALEHYQKYQSRLLGELGLEPEPETIALAGTIREDQLSKPPSPSIRTPSQPPPLPLLGRHTEFARLIDHWERSMLAKSSLILIQGEAGLGKTHLVEELSRYVLTQGGLALTGHCYEYGAPLAFQPIAAALRGYLDRLNPAGLSLNEVELVELAQLVPTLYEQYPHLPHPPDYQPGTHRYRLFEALAHFLQTLTMRQPVLLILEDLHWADADTFDMLGYLIRRLTETPLLIIGTYRSGEVLPHHPLLDLQRSLFNEGLVETLSLAELNQESVEQLVQTVLANLNVEMPASRFEVLAETICLVCQGNPFLALETLQEMKEQGWLQSDSLPDWRLDEFPFQQVHFIPDGVKSRVQRRMARLSQESQRLLSLAAVSGGPFDVRLLQQASGVSSDVLLDYLDDWLARRLVKELTELSPVNSLGQGNYDFDHHLTRAALYDELSLARRQQFHHQIGAALEKIYEDRIGLVIEHLAYHFHQAHEPGKALTYLSQAAHQAQTALAFHAAQDYYDQALKHWSQYYGSSSIKQTDLPLKNWRQRWDLLLNQAEICRRLGQFDRYQTALEIAAQEMAAWGEAQDELRLVETRLLQLEQQPDLEERYQLARKGLTLAKMVDNPLTKANLLQSIANCERDQGHLNEALTHYEEALTLFFQLNQTRRATFCLISVGSIHLMKDNFNEALDCFGQAVAYAQAEKGPESLTWSYQLMAYIRENLGRM